MWNDNVDYDDVNLPCSGAAMMAELSTTLVSFWLVLTCFGFTCGVNHVTIRSHSFVLGAIFAV